MPVTAESPIAEVVSKHDFGRFRPLQQHAADGTNRLARYDFLLVLRGDLGSLAEHQKVRGQRPRTIIPGRMQERMETAWRRLDHPKSDTRGNKINYCT